MQTEIMNNTHPEWEGFIDKLSIMTRCSHSYANSITILLRFYKGVNLSKSLDYFKRKGGYCDCEILMNVYRPLPENIEELLNELKY